MSKVLSRTVVHEGKWVRFVELACQNGDNTYTWEAIERTTHSKSDLSGTEILALIQYPESKQCTQIILIKQFRPATNLVVIEWPAGLIDNNEDPKSTAVRELQEETGYVGEVVHTSCIFASGPSLSSSLGSIQVMRVNGDDQSSCVNQELEEAENIEVLIIPLDDLYTQLEHLAKTEGLLIESRLLSFAFGLDFKNRFNL
ncbi:hypothetical protein GEMRC1_004615 [Eukaryota sp. GEM-RC1]